MTTFTINGTTFSTNKNGTYFYKTTGVKDSKGNELTKRVSKAIYDAALEEFKKTAPVTEEKAEAKKTTKKESKPRKSKDIAFELNGLTLTAKQVKFIQLMPNDDFYEHGLESALWIDVFCDTIAKEFNPMAVGAMVSTLREKNLVVVGKNRINGKTCKFFQFTELGKEVAKALGLN